MDRPDERLPQSNYLEEVDNFISDLANWGMAWRNYAVSLERNQSQAQPKDSADLCTCNSPERITQIYKCPVHGFVGGLRKDR